MKVAVVGTPAARRFCERQLRDMGIDFIGIGQALCGVRYDVILAHPLCCNVEDTKARYAAQWWEQSVRCRLEPGGKIDPNPWSCS